jgi:hypothetical protein
MYLICQKGPLLCHFGSKSVVFEFILVEKPKKQLYLADRGPWASLRASTAKRKTSVHLVQRNQRIIQDISKYSLG